LKPGELAKPPKELGGPEIKKNKKGFGGGFFGGKGQARKKNFRKKGGKKRVKEKPGITSWGSVPSFLSVKGKVPPPTPALLLYSVPNIATVFPFSSF